VQSRLRAVRQVLVFNIAQASESERFNCGALVSQALTTWMGKQFPGLDIPFFDRLVSRRHIGTGGPHSLRHIVTCARRDFQKRALSRHDA
jgi:hypothetical protein